MRISDWSSDVCSSDLFDLLARLDHHRLGEARIGGVLVVAADQRYPLGGKRRAVRTDDLAIGDGQCAGGRFGDRVAGVELAEHHRSEEHTSELQSLMRISYAVFCLKKKNTHKRKTTKD